MAWFISNAGTIFVTMVLLLIVALVVKSQIQNKKKGISSCGCNCANCPQGKNCHS